MSIFFVKNSCGQEVIWQENFDGYYENTSTAPGKWTGTNFGDYYAKVQRSELKMYHRYTYYSGSYYGDWYTASINTSEYETVEVSLDVFGEGNTHKERGRKIKNGYLLLQYKYDGNWSDLKKFVGNIKQKTVKYNLPIGNSVAFRIIAKSTVLDKSVSYTVDNIIISGVKRKKDKVLWLGADKGVAPSLGRITKWDDQSDYGNDAVSSFDYVEIEKDYWGDDVEKTYHHNGYNNYNQSSLNYNPGVVFNYVNKQLMMVPDNSTLDVSRLSVFTVINPTATNNYDGIVTKHGSNYGSEGFGLHYFPDGDHLKLVLNPNTEESNDFEFPNNSATVAVSHKPQLISATYDESNISLSTEVDSDIRSYSTIIKQNDSPVTIGADHTTLSVVDIFDGDINEIILYNYAVSDEEKDRIESYLAIKYGITLKHDYKFSNGQVIYSHDLYNQDIAGIASDGGWNLEQKISSTINKTNSYGSNIIISTENNFIGPNKSISTSLSNGQALVWGKNNGSTDTWIDDYIYKRTNEVWKFRNTGGVGNVYLQINLSNYNSYNYDFYLVVDTDNNLSNGVDSEHLLTDLGSNIYQSEVNFPSGVSYMTVVLKCASPKIPLNVSLPDNLNVCRGDNLDITATAVGGSGNYSYDFYVKTTSDSDFKDTPDQNSNNDTFPHVYSVTSDLKVIITDELGCVCTPVIKPVTVGSKIQTKEIARKK